MLAISGLGRISGCTGTTKLTYPKHTCSTLCRLFSKNKDIVGTPKAVGKATYRTIELDVEKCTVRDQQGGLFLTVC